MPRRNTPDHSYFDSVSTQLELSVGRSCAGVLRRGIGARVGEVRIDYDDF